MLAQEHCRIRRAEAAAVLLGGVFCFLQLASIWGVRFVPTQDGPVHLEMASQLRELAGRGGGVLDRYYEINPRPEPNWLVYPLLRALATSMSWVAAEKVVLSAYLLALPLALAYAVTAVRRESLFVALFAFPLAANYLFHMGFLNFSLSVPLGLVALGYGLRHAAALHGWRLVILAAWLLLTCAAHAVSACAVAAALCVAGMWRGGGADPTFRDRILGAARGLCGPLLASLPMLALVITFLAGPSRHAATWQPMADLLRRLLLLHVLVSFDRIELVPAAACSALLAGLVLWRLARRKGQRSGERGNELLAATALLTVLYFALPASLAGGGYLNPRLQLWVILVGLLWLAAEPWTPSGRRAITMAVAAISVAFITLHGVAYERLSRHLEEFVSVEPLLEPDSVVLPLSFVDQEPQLRSMSLSGYKVRPFEHALGYLACEHRLVDLTEYQADQGYFPVLFRPDRNPYRSLLPEEGEVTYDLGRLDLESYSRRAGNVDYVLLWGRNALRAPPPGLNGLLAQLGENYEKIFTSEPLGLAEVYRRRSRRLERLTSRARP